MAAAWPAHDRIPYRIEIADGPVVRCWDPRDTSLLEDAIDESLWHLRAWIPWAHDEPQSRDEKVALLRSFRGRFDLGQEFVYGVFSADESTVLGGAGLHPRAGDGALEIGYWVRADHVRRGIGTAVAAALTKVGIELGNAERIEIRVEVGNDASAAIPRRLGFHEEAILQRRLPAAGGGSRRDAIVFSLFADELDGSPAAGSRYLAFDSAGSPIA